MKLSVREPKGIQTQNAQIVGRLIRSFSPVDAGFAYIKGPDCSFAWRGACSS
jgi:hypothetical protein